MESGPQKDLVKRGLGRVGDGGKKGDTRALSSWVATIFYMYYCCCGGSLGISVGSSGFPVEG